MRGLIASAISVLTLFALGCNGGGSEGETSTSMGETSLGPTTSSSTTPGDGDGDPSTTTPGDGDGDPATGDGDGDPTTTTTTSTGPKFDTAKVPDSAGGCGGTGGGEEFSYIWIANSDQGTLSKVNTESLIEEGRYRVRPDSNGLPSRTSVNLSGDVAVANRSGGITKVYAREADCEDTNGTPGIQTSTGANDILAWGTEECIAWHTPMNYDSQRPIAWTAGTYSEGDCVYSDAKVWTTGTSGGGGYADVMLLNGDTGVIEEQVNIQGLTGFNSFGGYGAVVDSEGNLWFNEMWIFGDYLVKVYIDDMSYDLIPSNGRSGYGIAIDEEGRIWTCGGGSIHRFDPENNQWQTTNSGLSTGGGCMVDAEGQLWASNDDGGMPSSIIALDVDSLNQIVSHPMPEHLHGISIDFAGYVWGVAGNPGSGDGENAYRIDPDSGEYDVVQGFVDAYTYSDMTGFALASQGIPTG